MPGENVPDSTSPRERNGIARRFTWVLGVLAVVFAVFAAVTGSTWMQALKQVREGDKFELLPYIKAGLWWASAVNALLSAVLAATARWWARGSSPGSLPMPSAKLTRCAWLGLLLILAGAGALRWARLDLSFYNDEAHTFRRYIAGRFSQTKDEKVKWKPVDWVDTIWLNEVGNNLMPCSIFGRLSYDAWLKLAHKPTGTVSETAVRLQAWLSGMASLVVLWLLARRILPPAAAWWVLILAALHPWMVRYATEARGYGFLMLGVALAFYFLQRALEDERWRWWLGFGFAQFLCLWAFPGAVYFLASLDGLTLLRQGWAWKKRRGEMTLLLRPLVGLALAGMLTLQVMLPSMLQLMGAMRVLDSLKGSLNWVWWTDTLSGLGFGIRGLDQDATNPQNLALSRLLHDQPLLWVLIVMAAGLLVIGLVELLRRPGAAWILALVGPLAVVLSWAAMSAQGKYLHPWYLLYAVPGMILAWAAAPGWFTRWREFGPQALGKVALPVLGLFWFSLDLHYARVGKENVRGLAEAALGEKYTPLWQLPHPKRVFAAMLSDANLYDPWVRVIKTNAHEDGTLDGLIAEARKDHRELFVSVGHVGIDDSPKLLERLKTSGEFEPVATLWGLDEDQFTHHLFHLR